MPGEKIESGPHLFGSGIPLKDLVPKRRSAVNRAISGRLPISAERF